MIRLRYSTFAPAVALAIGMCLAASEAAAQPTTTSRTLYPSGKLKQDVIRAIVAGVPGLKQTDYNEDGTVQREIEWANGRLHGTTRVFGAQQALRKEVRFREDRIIEYAALDNGRLVTRINADRAALVHRGQPLTLRWDKYYEVRPGRKLIGFTQRGLLDTLLLTRSPESALQAMADIGAFFDSKTGGSIGEANDVVSCGNGRADIANDLGLKESTLKTAAQSGSAGVMRAGNSGPMTALAQSQAAISSVASRCGSASTSPRVGGGSTPGSRETQNARAEQVLTQAVASCQAGRPGTSSSSVVGIDLSGFKSLLPEVLEAMEATEAAEAATVRTTAAELAMEGSAIVESVPASSAASAAATAARGFVMTEVLVAGTAVVAAGAAGWAIGSLIEPAVSSILATWQETNDTFYQEQAAEARRAQEARARQQAGSSPPAGGAPSKGRPDPETAGRNPCGYLSAFKDFCTDTKWGPKQCAAFSAIVNGCRVNVDRIQVAPHEGDVFSAACPRNFGDRSAEATRQRCERRGMFSQPGVDGALACGHRGGFNAEEFRRGPDPNQINPTRTSP